MGVATVNAAGDNPINEAAEEAVARQPWVEKVARLGWLAKGAVYMLMGATAFAIGRGKPTSDKASPEGAVAQIVDKPGGTVLLAVLAIGLFLYSAWRLLSVALIRGNELRDWGDRVGYTFSALFYLVLGYTAISAVAQGESPEDKNTVERLSRTMLESSIGRWVLLLAGLVALGVGLYFTIEKGIRRKFCKDLNFADTPHAERKAVEWSGMAGWISRGLVTSAIGWFVVDAAWTVDQSDARGFDNAFREVASHDVGSIAVTVGGLGLVLYGVFCVLAVRHLDMDKIK
jgi:hypothetical protein